MDQRNIQARKVNISEEIKLLKYFVQQNSSIPGMRDEIMDYFQSLRRDLQNIESSVQLGEPPVSSNLNGTDLHHGQEITQQNAYFGPTLYQESDVVMSSNAQSLSCSKRKRWSKVWEDFTKYVDENGKEWAKCNNCKKEFVGLSKSGTTHLKNHLKSCQGLKTLSGVVNKEKEKNVNGLDLDDSNLVQRIIKYGLNSIKDDILVVYEQEKSKLRGYLEKLPFRFNLRIEWCNLCYWCMRIWFVDDSWELRNWIIYFHGGDDAYESVKSFLVDWNIDRKIGFVIIDDRRYKEDTEDLKNWFNEQGSLPFVVTCTSHSFKFYNIQQNFSFYKLTEISPNKILTKAYGLQLYVNTSSNVHVFNHAIEKALSMRKIVTSQSVPQYWLVTKSLIEWVLGCKEVFCELEHIDPHFKSISFTKEDWDDATLLYSSWQVIKDLEKEIFNSSNVHFSMVSQFLLRLDQLKKSDNHYLRTIASNCQRDAAKNWENDGLVLGISVILDPRCKMEMVECYYKMIFDDDVEAYCHKMIDEVTKIFNNYANGTSSFFSSHDNNSTSESELSCYLRENKHPQDEGFDILQWWRDKSPIYPTLVRMAHDFLSMPFNTANLDSSLLGEIETLDDDLKYKLACAKSWLNTPVNN